MVIAPCTSTQPHQRVFQVLPLAHVFWLQGLMSINPFAGAHGLSQRVYTDKSIDHRVPIPKNENIIQTEKGLRHGSKTLDIGRQRFACEGF